MPKTIYVSNFDFSLSWLTSLFRLGANHPLTANELYDLKFKCSGIEFKPTIANLFAANRSLVVIMMVFNILSTAASVAIPTFLSQLITFFAQKDENIFVGIKLSVILLSLQLLSIIWGNVAKHSQNVLFVQVRKILISEVYTKALHLSNSARLDLSHGKILNIINQDIGIVAFSLFYAGTDLIKNVALVAVSFKLLYDQLGLATWGGLGFVLAVIVVQIPGFIAWIGSQKGYLDKGDKRLNEIRAVLYGIKVIKFRALEEYFINRINELRKLQLVNLRNLYVAQVYVIGFFNIAPISAPLVAFILYGSFNKGVLSPEVIFPSLVLFGLLNQGLIAFPQNITNFAYAIISWKRIENLLTAEEGSALNQDKSLPKGQLDFIDACFQWDQRRARDHDEKAAKGENDEMVEMFSLNKIHMTVRSGSKVGIVGAVGSGKSSLFSALIGEMNSTGGKFAWNGKLAYCDQQPWLISDTLRANILLNREFDNDRLQYVISMCDLDKDFKELPMGDLTVVGENGVNLSGGQKARVALARALYNNSDIYLLDDPLSALDAQTGKHVFDNAIMGALDTKTVLLITHQLQVLSQLDYIFVLSQGKIVEQGAYRDLIAKRGLLFDMMQNSFISKKGGTDSKIELSGAVKEHKQKDIMEKEDQEQGSVKPVTYWNYVKVCGGWPFLISLTIITLLRSALIALSGIWLQWWTDGQNHFGYRPSQPSTTIFFQVGYGILGALQLFVMELSIFAVGSFRSAKMFHSKSFKHMIHAPMKFFESQPIGRIVNRFSRDISIIDSALWLFFVTFVDSITNVLSSVTVLFYSDLRMLLVIVPLLIIYTLMIIYYQRSNREFKRHSSTLNSSLHAHISETLSGAPTLKAYQIENVSIQKGRRLLDKALIPAFLSSSASLWLNIRMELLSNLVFVLLCTLAFLKTVNPYVIGLALTYALQFCNSFKFLLFGASQVDAEMNCVERMSVYCSELPQEAARRMDSDPKPEFWPSSGIIEFQNISVSYPSRPDHNVLNDLTFNVRSGEKIGIVGRTGSGKSSLMLALFRILELNKGKIRIDGIDISTLGLETLRKGLQIIPQDPTLFKGSVRLNLDLEDVFSDTQIWEALKMVGLDDYVSKLDSKLESMVEEGGSNLSVGQRQLICLARAILAKPKILIMDEATASVDFEADRLIQASIKSNFQETTLLCIAHRVNTIADFDRILVLQDGRLADYDTPSVLLQREGLFSELSKALDE